MITAADLRELDTLASTMQRHLLIDPDLSAMYKWARQMVAKGIEGDTGLREHEGEAWPVIADLVHSRSRQDYDEPVRGDHATLRRIGWLDQRGRVWLKIPPGSDAWEMRCGSFTPLLIDVRGDD